MKPLSSVEGLRALEVVVCLEDSILDVIHLRTPGQVRAGHDPGCQVVLPAETLGGRGSIVLASLDATGQAYAARALDDSGALQALEPKDNISLEAGKLRVFVRTVPDTQTAARGGWGLDAHTLQVVAASVVGHLVFVGLLLAIPPDARAVNGLDFYAKERFIRLQSKPLEESKQELQKSTQPGSVGRDAGEQAAAHSGDPGKMGRPDTRTTGRTSFKGEQKVDRPGNVSARDWVSNRGPLGIIRATDFSPILGNDEQWASKDRWAYGSDMAAAPGDGPGSFGAGHQGTSTGGCPPGTRYCNGDSIGSGKWPTIGHGPGDRFEGSGPGTSLRPRGKNDHMPVIIHPPRVDDGGLDKAIIKRYIRDQIAAISYCYEKQLTVQAQLGGTISVEFVIGPNGAVISARGDGTAGSPAVDACVLDEVRSIQFPRSDGMTNVKYPFTFHTTGQ